MEGQEQGHLLALTGLQGGSAQSPGSWEAAWATLVAAAAQTGLRRRRRPASQTPGRGGEKLLPQPAWALPSQTGTVGFPTPCLPPSCARDFYYLQPPY